MKIRPCCAALLGCWTLLALGGGCGGNDWTYTMEISREEVQESLDSSFPITFNAKSFGGPSIKLVLSDPEALLEEGRDQLGYRLKAVIELPEKFKPPKPKLPTLPKFPSLSGAAASEEKTDRLEDGTIDGVVTIYGDMTYDAERGGLFFLKPQVDELTIEDLPEALVKPISLAVEMMLNDSLSKNAVYSYGDDVKSQATKAVLQTVEAKGGKLVVTLGL